MKAIAFSMSLLATSVALGQGSSAAQDLPAAEVLELALVAPDEGAPGTSADLVERDTSSAESYGASPRTSERGQTASFIAYDFGVPVGSLRDFAANVSPIGVELQLRGWVADRFSLGLSAEWSTFVDERSRTTFSVENAAVTASAYNRLQMTNARLAAHYYIGQGSVRPYIGPHAGVGWTWFEAEVADLELSETQFSMIFGGELGALFGRDPSVLANIRYSWMPGAEFLGLVSNVQTISAQVGIGL